MTPLSAFAGVAHSRAAKAPASHILRFISWRPLLTGVCGSAPYPFSRNPCACQIRLTGASRENAKPSGKTDPSPASEGGTPYESQSGLSYLHRGRTGRKNRGESPEKSLRLIPDSTSLARGSLALGPTRLRKSMSRRRRKQSTFPLVRRRGKCERPRDQTGFRSLR